MTKGTSTKALLSVALSVCFLSLSFGQISFPTQSVYKYLKGSEAAGLPGNWMDPGFNDV